jgi:hypothetical protein
MEDLQGVTREETLDEIESVGIEALRDYVEHIEEDHINTLELLRECRKRLDGSHKHFDDLVEKIDKKLEVEE